MADINRTTNSMALPSDISSEILQKMQEGSAVMRLARQITLPGNGKTIPVITSDPQASWVSETAAKPVSNPGLSTKLMQAYKLAVIVPFSDEFRRDAAALYDALIARLPLALAQKFDQTVIGAVDKPGENFDNFALCTAQKLVLNMLSTGAMVKTGKVVGNLMVNVRPTNVKLRDRCIRILMELGDCDRETAEALIDKHGDIRKSLSELESAQ